VAVYPNIAANNLFATSGAVAAAGGVGGTTTTAAGGAAGTIATDAGMPFQCFGLSQYIAGVAGTAAGSGGGNNAGTALSVGTACMIL
jgi:hypothetical protein